MKNLEKTSILAWKKDKKLKSVLEVAKKKVNQKPQQLASKFDIN